MIKETISQKDRI